MREFSYKKDYEIISSTIKGYIKELYKELTLLVEYEHKDEYIIALEKIQDFQNKYPNLYDVSNKILEDLTSPYCVNYYYDNNCYPENASIIGQEFERDLKEIIFLEESLRNIAVKEWESCQTEFVDITNGGDFTVIGHSTLRIPKISFNDDKNKNNVNRNQYFSCTLFTQNELNTFQGIKTVYIVDVNDDNFIAASSFDATTMDISSPSFQTIKEIKLNGVSHYIKVGYVYDVEVAVTTILTPRLVEMLSVSREIKENGEMYNYKNSTTNEIVLDRSKVNIKGVLLIGNGCDLLLGEYLFLKISNNTFKCINKGIYREKQGLSAFTEEEYTEFLRKLEKLHDYYEKGIVDKELLKNYYDEVVLPMQYNETIMNVINENFSKYINIPLKR